MQHSPTLQADSHSASQEIQSVLWNPKDHYRVQIGPPLVSVLSELNAVYIPTPYLRCILILFYLRLGHQSCLLYSDFPTKMLETFLICPMRATCPTHLTFIEFVKLQIVLFPQFPSLQIFPYHILPSILFRFSILPSCRCVIFV
jgi:hypothetical protein